MWLKVKESLISFSTALNFFQLKEKKWFWRRGQLSLSKLLPSLVIHSKKMQNSDNLVSKQLGMSHYSFTHNLQWRQRDDIILLSFQGGPLLFSKFQFIFVWLFRELLSPWTFLEAFIKPRTISWGTRTYQVRLGGDTSLVRDESKKCKS